MTSPYTVFIGFFIYSFGLGTLFPRIGDIQLAMGLGESVLGLALIGLPIGLQISLLVADRVLRQYSVRLVMIAGMAMIGIAYVSATFASTPIEFFFSSLEIKEVKHIAKHYFRIGVGKSLGRKAVASCSQKIG